MKRLMSQISDLSWETCQKVLLPLVRTYVFNPDYDSHNLVVETAIECIGSLASKLPYKNWEKLLQQFLNMRQKPLEPKYQKQRVKVLASILDAYHFEDVASMTKAKALVEKLLRRKSTTGQATFFKDGVEEKEKQVDFRHFENLFQFPIFFYFQADLGLYLPILKILLLLPSKDELNNHVSTLIVTAASQLRSRRKEEREPARKILCEMAALLGPIYLPHIISVLKAQLQRGYQVHILVFTTHAILSHLLNTAKNSQDNEQRKALDLAIQPILEMVKDELFSNLMEEKKVAAIVKNTFEAKKTVSYNMLVRF